MMLVILLVMETDSKEKAMKKNLYEGILASCCLFIFNLIFTK